MVKKSLFVRMEAKQGKEKEVEDFLRNALPMAQDERDTTVWFAIRLGPRTFAVFDAFPDESGREAHLSGRIAALLKENTPKLLEKPPYIEKADVLAAKMPG